MGPAQAAASSTRRGALLAAAFLLVLLLGSPWLATPSPELDRHTAVFWLLNILAQLVVWSGFVLLTGRLWCSSIALAWLVLVITIVNNLKYRYSGTVALPIDLIAVIGILRDARTFLGYLSDGALGIGGSIVAAAIAVLAFFKERPLFPFRARVLLVRAAGVALVGWLCWSSTAPESPIQRLYLAAGAQLDADAPNALFRQYGLVGHLVIALPACNPDIPQNYGNPAYFNEYYRNVADTLKRRGGDPAVLPDIVAILSESFFDPRGLRISIDPPVLTSFDRIASEADYSGRLGVHTIGGGTVRTEFSFLTGVPTNIFAQRGLWPFHTLVRPYTGSLAKALKRLGYRTVAVYPVPGSFFNGRNAYTMLGFDEFLDQSDFDTKEYADFYINDAALARKVREIVQASARPVFVAALTMENHGPWSFRRAKARRVYTVGGRMSAESQDMLEDYVHRLPDVERTAVDVRDFLAARGKPFVFAFYGDHLPAMFKAFDEVGFAAARTWRNPRFETPYFVISNLPGRSAPSVKNIDVSFLASLVLDVAGVNRDEFFRRNAAYRELCAGRFEGCDPGDGLRRSYAQILYNRVAGRAGEGDRLQSRSASLVATYRLGDAIRPGAVYFGAGWGGPEPPGSWTIGPDANLAMRVEGEPGDLILAASLGAAEKVSTADVTVNGQRVGTWTFPEGQRDGERRVRIPAAVARNGLLAIKFLIPNPRSPHDLKISPDTRKLGLLLHGMRLCAASAGECRPIGG